MRLPPQVVEVLERAREITADPHAVPDAGLVHFVRQAQKAIASLSFHPRVHPAIKGSLCLSGQGGLLEQFCVRMERGAWRLFFEDGAEGREPEEILPVVDAGRHVQLAVAAGLPTFVEMLASTVAVRIQWLPTGEGGRLSPPTGPNWSAVARFEALAERWPDEGWSVVLYLQNSTDLDGGMVAGMRLLALDEGPMGVLDPGSRFDLWEGRWVARGVVI
ncbi:MAG TPA: hypothetical protein VFM53_08295 [Anaeromyxobacteraceae bacterium]|nr:hypothetical protein [Anaeromyxobacteraceae bacterium]